MKFTFARDWIHAGVTYKPGDVAELSDAHAARLKGKADVPEKSEPPPKVVDTKHK